MLTVRIWKHWFSYYLDFIDEDGRTYAQEHFNSLDEARAEAERWGAFVIIEGSDSDEVA